jgi:hypothetical protein
MMEQVEARSPRGHMRPVSKALTSLFALFALMLMPLGMSGASAAAAAHTSSAVAAAPCDEHGGEKGTAPAEAEQHCATCMAVPVAVVAQAPVAPLPKAPRSMASATPFLGLEPEVSTPPPKDV